MARILITNDDGIKAPALDILREMLLPLGEVTVVAPEYPKNAVANSMTLHKPVRLNRYSDGTYAVSGTPADCVRIGILTVLEEKVDLVISGINAGANLGDDVNYSGTVGAAREAALIGVPSLAASLVLDGLFNFRQAAAVTVTVAEKILNKGIPKRTLLNLNIPDIEDGKVLGILGARLGERIYDSKVRKRQDPAGRDYYWILGNILDGVADDGTDFSAVNSGYASLSPIKLDYTDYEFYSSIKNWISD